MLGELECVSLVLSSTFSAQTAQKECTGMDLSTRMKNVITTEFDAACG